MASPSAAVDTDPDATSIPRFIIIHTPCGLYLGTAKTPSNRQTSDTTAATEAKFRAARSALAEEHAQIMSLVDVLRDAPDPRLLVPRLEELHTLLVNHFAHEQFPGGLYESMGAFGSRWHDTLRELIRDHCLILSEARAILERAREATPAARTELQAGVISLVEQLSEHERKEHRLAGQLQTVAVSDGDRSLEP